MSSGLDTTFEAHQALSRSIAPARILDISGSPTERRQWHLRAKAVVSPRKIDFTFARLVPANPSAGAFQFKDPDVVAMHQLQWPYLASISGRISASDVSPDDSSSVAELLLWLRQALWNQVEALEPFNYPRDQFAKTAGYRREFIHRQMLDITQTRRPSPQGTFVDTQESELIGPGCVTFPDLRSSNNELVWGRILPLSNSISFQADKPRIEAAMEAEYLLVNSYSELKDARDHLDAGRIKAAIRSAAPAAEAAIRHRAAASNLSFPSGHMSFSEKIDAVLEKAGYAKYSTVDQQRSINLLHLYRTRNSMHKGACFYNDSQTGDRVEVSTSKEVEPLLDAAEAFLAWIDPLQ